MNTSFTARLGHTFRNPALLQKALTHRSFYFENRSTSPGHFERLEFLGDAVLDLILSEILMESYPDVEEGTLSKWRASLVNENTLADIARELELGQYLFLGNSESGRREDLRPRLLASAFEAVLAALYMDAGFEKTREFVTQAFTSRVKLLNTQNEFAADFKTRLQEISQKRFHVVPEYRLVSAEGPDHAKVFVYDVYVNDQALGTGRGNSRKSAEQEAAKDALSKENIQ